MQKAQLGVTYTKKKAMSLVILYYSSQFHDFPKLSLNSQERLRNINSLCSRKGRHYVLFQSIKDMNTWKTHGDPCYLHWKGARPRLKMSTPLLDTSS